MKKHAARCGRILGLCGGYQLLGREILDPLGVESDRGRVGGLGLLPLTTTLAGDKILRRVVGVDLPTGRKVEGYEIHMGRTRPEAEDEKIRPMLRIHEPGSKKKWEDGWTTAEGRIRGTYVHGLLDSPSFRLEFLNELRRAKGLPQASKASAGRSGRFRQYDRLAEHFEKHVDVPAVLKTMGL